MAAAHSESEAVAVQPADLWLSRAMPQLDAKEVLALTPSSTASTVWTEASESKRKPEWDNLLIFDWDDTLLSTAAINRGTWTDDQLKMLFRAVEAVLRVAMSLGQTLIVTNGNDTWVQDSARAYLPELLPLLDELKVISARAQFEEEHPGNPFAWKRRCFCELTSQWRRLSGSDELPGFTEERSKALNMLVLGDSIYEIEAAEGLQNNLSVGSLIKTVKFVETPAIEALIGQLLRVVDELPLLVGATRSETLNLHRSMRHMATDALAWSVVDHREYQRRIVGDASPVSDDTKNKQIINTGLLSWMQHQLLCKEPNYLGQFEEAYDDSTVKDQADFSAYMNRSTPYSTPWQN